MASTQTDFLFRLVKSMTKAEKRSFKLFANRIGSGDDTALFIQLFDVLDRQHDYDEENIFQKVPSMKRSQLSNLKRHLYRQILTSLRLVNITKNLDIELREQVDFARILYSRGLFQQSLKILDRAKTIAMDAHQDVLHLEIIEFEKQIETRHVTRSIENRAEHLVNEAEKRSKVVMNASILSNLTLKLYGIYVEIGHAKNEKDIKLVNDCLKNGLPPLLFDDLTFFEKIYYCQSFAWYHYILQNFPYHYRYCQKWVDLFEEFPAIKTLDPELYLRGLHNLLTALFYNSQYRKFSETLLLLEGFMDEMKDSFSLNEEVLSQTFYYTAKINKHFMEGTFTEGLALVPPLKKMLKENDEYLDSHRILVFYYKIACMYFGSGDNSRAIDYLNDIINYKAGNLVGDIQCYARILHLIAHFEMGHFNLLEYLVKSVYRFLGKMEDLNTVQKEILRFLRKEIRTDPKSLRQAFEQLYNKLGDLKSDPKESRAFLYLDINSWLQSKIEGKTVQEIVKLKIKN